MGGGCFMNLTIVKSMSSTNSSLLRPLVSYSSSLVHVVSLLDLLYLDVFGLGGFFILPHYAQTINVKISEDHVSAKTISDQNS